MEGAFYPPGRGGNDPARQAAIQQLGRVPVSRPDVQAQAPQMGQPGMGQPGAQGGNPQLGNEVAFHLSNAFQALAQTGPTPENLSAVKQFVYSIAELNAPGSTQGGQAPGQQMAGGPPQMQPGMPPQM